MTQIAFSDFFQKEAGLFLMTVIKVALSEDGPDLTSDALFGADEVIRAQIVAKDDAVVAGLPVINTVFSIMNQEKGLDVFINVDEGDKVSKGALLAMIQAPAPALLKAERVILNFVCHLSGIATLTRKYVDAMGDAKTTLLDTRKTLPGLRYPEKYAVLAGGGMNHRKNLAEMLMLKDNHIDRAGDMRKAVDALRQEYDPCPPIEVECRNLNEVEQALEIGVERIMLDNMDPERITQALKLVDGRAETEISGNVDLENIGILAGLGADYISVGRITHSAPYADFSMVLVEE